MPATTAAPAIATAHRHLVAVWDPARLPDAMEATLGALLALARAHGAGRLAGGEDDVYVWWGKIRSPNRQQPMGHLGDVLALDAAIAGSEADADGSTRAEGSEVQLYLTDYRALYVAHVAEVTADDPRCEPDAEQHIPAGLYPPSVACDCWFRLFDIRRLVLDDTREVVAELKKLRNLGYHGRPVSLYGGMVDLPLLVERPDGARWFDHAARARLTDGRFWVEFDTDHAGVGAVAASLRDDVLGNSTWAALDPAARLFVATAERIFRDHRADAAFDFSPVVVNFAKAYEVQLGLVLGAVLNRLPRDVGLVNVEGRTVDAFAGGRVAGLGVLARVFGEDLAFRRALPHLLTHPRWVVESLAPVLGELAAARNAGAHTEVVSRVGAQQVRDAQLGVGMASHLVALARVRGL